MTLVEDSARIDRQFKTSEAKRIRDRQNYAKRDKTVVMAQRRAYYEANKPKILARTRIWTIARLAEFKRIADEAKSKPCMDCGRSFPLCCMDLDHRPGEKKIASISELRNNWKISKKTLIAEIDKCDLVCANCHRIRTTARKQNEQNCGTGSQIF